MELHVYAESAALVLRHIDGNRYVVCAPDAHGESDAVAIVEMLEDDVRLAVDAPRSRPGRASSMAVGRHSNERPTPIPHFAPRTA